MINDIKMSFKIIKYGINVKTTIVFSVIFFVLSFLLDMVNSSGVSAMYIPLISIYFGQMIHSVVQSTMVQSSPHKKALQTKLPALAMVIVLFVGNTLSVLWKCLLIYVNPERAEDLLLGMAVGCISTLVIMVYFSFAMKLYWPATICFLLIFYAFCFESGFRIGADIAGADWGNTYVTLSMPVMILLSYLSILIGGGIIYGVNVLLYKKDYSQQNFKKALDRMK